MSCGIAAAKTNPERNALNFTGTSDLSIGTSTIGGPENSAAANIIRTQTCSDDAMEGIGAANFSVRTGVAKAFVSVTAGEKPGLDSKTFSPTWDRAQLEGHSIGKIPKTITRRSIANGARKASRSTIRLDICGRTNRHRRFPQFEMRTSKSTICSEASRTDQIIDYRDLTAPIQLDYRTVPHKNGRC